MSLYTTPLQFGYFFSLLMWLLFIIRGYREDRLSDKLLGWVMFILAMELQDYTFGFAGINVLWNELNGFPRGVSLLFGPTVYFYFLAQVNRSFRLEKKHLWHLVPWAIAFVYEFSAFVRGPGAVEAQQTSTYHQVLIYVERIGLVLSIVYYLSRCMKIYKSYRGWSLTQFSNTERINFIWFRNFIYAMIFWLLFRQVMNILDAFLNLEFYQDWWWNLALVAVSLYIGLAGYEQKQPAKIQFTVDASAERHPLDDKMQPKEVSADPDQSVIAERLDALMKKDRLFLQPDLSLQQLAQHLQTNAVHVSATINQVFKQNFNDYVNSLRIDEFIKLYRADERQKYTLLSLALDSGFNSKATFNRAFKKIKGSAPREYLEK